MTREQLIEKVRTMIDENTLGPEFVAPSLARDLVALVEEAYAPTGDERMAAQAYADAEYPESKLAAENEAFADVAERAFLAGARFRRTVQGEPSDEAVRAALRQWFRGMLAGGWAEAHEDRMRAALRAAAAVEGGETRVG